MPKIEYIVESQYLIKISKSISPFLEPQILSSCSQEIATQSTPVNLFPISFIIILSLHLCFGLPSDLYL